MQLPLHLLCVDLALACAFQASPSMRTHVRIASVRTRIYRTNRCSPQRTHLSPGACSVRCASPARSSRSRTTMPSTGRSTGTSHLVRRLIRIECRCAGDPFAGGKASRLRARSSASPPSPRRPRPRRLADERIDSQRCTLNQVRNSHKHKWGLSISVDPDILRRRSTTGMTTAIGSPHRSAYCCLHGSDFAR
jgi:hypothetical protein